MFVIAHRTLLHMLKAILLNPRAENLLAMVSRLKKREGMSFSITSNNNLLT